MTDNPIAEEFIPLRRKTEDWPDGMGSLSSLAAWLIRCTGGVWGVYFSATPAITNDHLDERTARLVANAYNDGLILGYRQCQKNAPILPHQRKAAVAECIRQVLNTAQKMLDDMEAGDA